MSIIKNIWFRTRTVPTRFAELPVTATLALTVCWLVIEFVWLGKYSLFIAGDNISVIPYLSAFADTDTPFSNWTPFPAAGTDMVATGYGILVFQWVFSILPVWAAYQVLAIAPILAGVVGVYGLCRKTFRLDSVSSCFAGFAYGTLYFRELFFLSGVQGYLPLTILALSYLLDDKTRIWRWIGLVAVGFLMSHSSFISRLVPWPLATYFLWFLIIERRNRLVDWLIVALFSVVILAARWQDIVALLSYAPLSAMIKTRGGGTLEVEMSVAVGSVVGNFFLKNALPLALFGGFLASLRNGFDGGKANLLVALAALTGLLFLGAYLKVVLISYLPFLSAYNMTYIMQGFGVFIALMGGIAFSYFKVIPRTKSLTILGAVPTIAVIWLLATNAASKINHLKAWVSWGNVHQNTQNPVFKGIAKSIRDKKEPQRVLSFMMHGALLNSYGLETLAGYHPMTSIRYQQFWAKMSEGWHKKPGWQINHGGAEVGSVISILPDTIGGAGFTRVQSGPQDKISEFVNLNLLSLANGGYITSRDRLTDAGLVLMSGPESSWNKLTRIEKIRTNVAANFTGKQNVFVYRNPDVLPRVFTVDGARVLNAGNEVLDHLGMADLDTLSRTVFLEKANLPSGYSQGTPLDQTGIAIRTYQNDHIEIDISKSPSPTIAVVSNSFSPYWRCQLDGSETAIVPADHAFWGIFIPAGATKLTCDYRPPYRLW